MTHITTRRLGRRFSGQWAVRGLTSSIAGGRITAILGANGAGKSTLLRLLAGQLAASEGEILLDDRRMRVGSVSLRRKVMLLAEVAESLDRIPVFLASYLRDYNANQDGVEETVANWISRFGLIDKFNQPIKEISKGQRFKIALTALFTIDAPIWLLDEPMSAGLDAAGTQTLERQMKAHVARGGTVVFSSQWPQHAIRLADDAIVLHQGHGVWKGEVGSAVSVSDELSDDESLQAVVAGLEEVTR